MPSYYDQPTLSPEQALPAFRRQLDELVHLSERPYAEAKDEDDSWWELTLSLIIRAFGKESQQFTNFNMTSYAGALSSRIVPPGYRLTQMQLDAETQAKFEARCSRRIATLKAQIRELEILSPTSSGSTVYDAGDPFAFYSDLAQKLRMAKQSVFVCDPYLSKAVFDTYLDEIQKSCSVLCLTSAEQYSRNPGLLNVAKMFRVNYPNLQFRTSTSIHDRLITIDEQAWVVGQSIKDAATRKGTYMVQVDKASFWPAYRQIWESAQSII
jgi:hypothetical protein